MKKILSVLLIFCVGAIFSYICFVLQNNTEQKSDSETAAAETEEITDATTKSDAAQNYIAEATSESEGVIPSKYEISDFPYTLQTPELPTGCEITALTMALNYYGCNVDKLTMATQYLPTVPADMYYDEYGVMHGEDLNDYFISDPQSVYGYVCGTNAIVTAANSYLADSGSSLSANDITGYSFDELYELVANDTPIVVWITIGMQQRSETEGWYTDDGDYVEWSQSDHAGVLVGYTDDTVIIADPLSGRTEYSRSDFESVYTSRGNHGVILQ